MLHPYFTAGPIAPPTIPASVSSSTASLALPPRVAQRAHQASQAVQAQQQAAAQQQQVAQQQAAQQQQALLAQQQQQHMMMMEQARQQQAQQQAQGGYYGMSILIAAHISAHAIDPAQVQAAQLQMAQAQARGMDPTVGAHLRRQDQADLSAPIRVQHGPKCKILDGTLATLSCGLTRTRIVIKREGHSYNIRFGTHVSLLFCVHPKVLTSGL